MGGMRESERNERVRGWMFAQGATQVGDVWCVWCVWRGAPWAGAQENERREFSACML
jgi:hypothetical protein